MLFIIKLLSIQQQLLFIFSFLLIFCYQNLSIQNISYCLEDINYNNDDENLNAELERKKLIGIGLFIVTFTLFWLYLATCSGSNFPGENILESLPSTIDYSNNVQILQNNETQTIGNHYTIYSDFVKANKLLLKKDDWVSSQLYEQIFFNEQRIVNDTNLRAEYIEEIQKKYMYKNIFINGQPDHFVPFDTWAVQNILNQKK